MSTPEINMTEFRQRVFDAVRAIPKGEARSYGDVAEAVGSPTASRAVGQALMPLDFDVNLGVPWWRVVQGDGRVNTAEAEAKWPDAVARHRKMLVDEGVAMTNDGRVASIAGRGSSSTSGGRSSSRRQPAPAPCWRHDTVQYSCRDCAPTSR